MEQSTVPRIAVSKVASGAAFTTMVASSFCVASSGRDDANARARPLAPNLLPVLRTSSACRAAVPGPSPVDERDTDARERGSGDVSADAMHALIYHHAGRRRHSCPPCLLGLPIRLTLLSIPSRLPEPPRDQADSTMATTTSNAAVGFPDRAVPMRVIVCGLHRTGTMSTRTALRQLGFHDCYHMATVLENIDDDPQQWVRAFEAKYEGKGSFTRQDWDRLMGRSQSCCDLPSALFSCELAEMYPDAKVVILNREADKWYESALASVAMSIRPSGIVNILKRLYVVLLDPQTRNWMRLSRVMTRLAMPFDHAAERDKAIAWFNERYAEFRDRIPAERRIEYSVQDGWAPLCAHLGVPVPTVMDETTGEMVEAPFPRVNDRATFQANAKRRRSRAIARANENVINQVGRVCAAACVGYGIYLAWRMRLGGRS
ncbi:hypothetical protein DCS_00160 [Drechmeria coniospora]|uniref:NAD dependent epimerase/dehydratase n=1 Tax=Drechmeria coniospora TaxID=98403 RepID=A0A151GPL6_DRECN|nr:hypothetical protein DCS_00160 [Drechmeria coniospora]KYK59033.1 hypothetical protein DCS_00160 [Drechmeria coniospora]